MQIRLRTVVFLLMLFQSWNLLYCNVFLPTKDATTIKPTTQPKSISPELKAPENKCLSDTRGQWRESPAKTALSMLMNDEPFAWIRWGDGEIIDVNRGLDFGTRLKRVLKSGSSNTVFVCVATWWFCNPQLRAKWNAAAIDATVYDTVYLPMGDPMSNAGTAGWAEKARVSDNVIAVVPRHLRSIPIFSKATFVDSPKAKSIAAVDAAIEKIAAKISRPSIVFIAAGASAKIIAFEMFKQFPNSSFIDIGSVLDGYAGVHSRDYNDPKKYCERIKGKERIRWFAPGVCQQ